MKSKRVPITAPFYFWNFVGLPVCFIWKYEISVLPEKNRNNLNGLEWKKMSKF